MTPRTLAAPPRTDTQNDSQSNVLGLQGLFCQAGEALLPERVILSVEVDTFPAVLHSSLKRVVVG